MSAKTEIPTEGSFSFVLRRYDYLPTSEQRVVGYKETAMSRNIEFDGANAPTIFIRGKNFAERAAKLGWVDITDLWFGRVDSDIPEPSSVAVDDPDDDSVITAPDAKSPRRRRVKRRNSAEG